MNILKLQAKTRASRVKIEARDAGELSAVFYGAGKTSTSIAVNAKEFGKIWKEAGESSLVTLTMPEGDLSTLIHEVQLDPVSDQPIHVDFLAIDINKEIEVKVPLEFEGVSEAVKSGLGSLVKVMYEVEIKGLPKNLPHNIKVDISLLKTLEDKITIANLVLPADVRAVNKDSDIVALVRQMQEEKEETPVDISQIEISEKRGKEAPAENEAEAEVKTETKPASRAEKK